MCARYAGGVAPLERRFGLPSQGWRKIQGTEGWAPSSRRERERGEGGEDGSNREGQNEEPGAADRTGREIS
jgi:hypothetical protein